MPVIRRTGIFILLFGLAFLVQGCATKGDHSLVVPDKQALSEVQPPAGPEVQHSPRPPDHFTPISPPTPSPKPSAPTPPPAAVQPTPARKQRPETASYQEVLDECETNHRKRPRDQDTTSEYVKNVETMRTTADRAFGEEEYAAAGRIYDLLLNRYGQFRSFTQILTFDRPYLTQKLATCKRSLSVRGFHEYRKGNLNRAIVQWQGLLAIDPQNDDIRKAMTTAMEQQKNLQKRK